jgi:hypothetical protein
MILKLIFLVFVILLIGFVIAIIVYRNRKISPHELQHENIIQFDAEHANVEHYLDYVIQKFNDVAIAVAHHPRQKRIEINGHKYQLNLYDRSNINSGFYVLNRKRHQVFINKLCYTCIESRAYVINEGEVEITKMVCLNTNFQHVRLVVFVCTATHEVTSYFGKAEFERAFSVFKFIAGEIKPGEEYVVLGDFGCQNWDFLRSHVLADAQSTGQYDVPTRKRGNKISAPHGLVAAHNVYGKFELTTGYIDTLYTSNELLWSCKYYKDFKVKKAEMSIEDSTYRMSCAINSKDVDTNLMLLKTVPSISDIDRSFEVRECEFLPRPRCVQIEDALNYLYKKNLRIESN